MIFQKLCVWYFNRSTWKILGDIPNENKYLVIVGPHTSFWDFIIGVAVRYLIKKDIKFLAKKELFKFPLKNFFISLGGYPVDRTKKLKLVDQVINLYRSHDHFAIALTPEGTRKRVKKWRTGFYHIALGAGIPLYLTGLDYSNNTVHIKGPLMPCGDIEKDCNMYVEFFKNMKGKIPEKGIFDDTTCTVSSPTKYHTS